MIVLDRVSKAYRATGGRRIILDNASATFEAGHNYGILGGNGAGKSTLIRLLAGSELPDRGTIRRRGRVSFPLGFGGTFHGALSGRENAAFLARIYGAPVRATLDFVADFAELGDYFTMPVNTYSAGMRARLAFSAGNAQPRFAPAWPPPTSSWPATIRRRCANIATAPRSSPAAHCRCTTMSAPHSGGITACCRKPADVRDHLGRAASGGGGRAGHDGVRGGPQRCGRRSGRPFPPRPRPPRAARGGGAAPAGFAVTHAAVLSARGRRAGGARRDLLPGHCRRPIRRGIPVWRSFGATRPRRWRRRADPRCDPAPGRA